jgi:hypothetical protein
VAVAVASARLIPAEFELPQLAPLTVWLPEVPVVSGYVSSFAIAWFAGATLVGPFAFLMWAFRVRKVEIAPDAVRIWRGLRPLPRTYSRPLYGQVVRIDNAVYVGKSEGLNLMNASASPMLAEGEAPWVAAEMRRALRQTAR